MKNNPYLVRLNAWKPETDKPWEFQWKFRWFIDNYKVEDTFSTIVEYEFGTAGVKRIALEAYVDGDSAKIHRSDDVFVDVKGDLTPKIIYDLVEESGNVSIHLDASSSTGTKIDRSNYKWKLSGSNINGNLPPEEFSGEKVIRNLNNYSGNIYVTLTVSSLPVMGQVELIREEKSYIELVPLGLREIKPVITGNADSTDITLYTFDGSSSLGNIEWAASVWEVFGPDNLYFQTQGKSSFTYKFPERSEDTNYTVVLTARNRATGNTTSASKMITVGEVPIAPVIDYKVITTDQNGEIVTAKLLLSAANSMGNDIDWNNVRWNVPLAGDYGGSSTQTGATAVYNLYIITEGMAVDVNLTIQRRSASDIVEVSEVIVIKNGEVPAIEPYIDITKDENYSLYETAQGNVYIFSSLNSKGANIDWNNVTWLVDNQYSKQGPVVRVDIPDSGEDNQSIIVTLTLKSTGGGEPVTKTMNYDIKSKQIKIVVSQDIVRSIVSAEETNIVKLSVRDSMGRNIDWERTKWFICQGPEDIIEKFGAEIVHTLPLSGDKEYYPVSVQMFFKESALPFIRNFNVRVEGNELKAIIKEEYDTENKGENKYLRTFNAGGSLGANIDWQNCKWTFGDSSEYQYGPVVSHKFPVDNDDASYLVTLTITRRTKAGEQEISTDTYTVNIGKDEMEAKIKILQSGNYVVFSAEESEGRGLLLDRSIWYFEGSDSKNYSESDADTQSISSSHSCTISAGHSFDFSQSIGYSPSMIWGGITANTTFGFGYNTNLSTNVGTSGSISESLSQSSGESSNNIYSGASCRKMVTGWSSKRVTLVIYRALPDGTVEAQSKSFIYTAGNDVVQIIE